MNTAATLVQCVLVNVWTYSVGYIPQSSMGVDYAYILFALLLNVL